MAVKNNGGTNKYLLTILLLVGFEWLRSSFGKFQAGDFAEKLPKTLMAFASKNPYPVVKDFLLTVGVPNGVVFGTLVQWGELFAALTIVGVAAATLLGLGKLKKLNYLLAAGLLVGAALNLTFWLASGWMSPSGDGLNLLMLGVELVGLSWVLGSVVS